MRESLPFRVFAIAWVIASLSVASCAFVQMMVTFAPPQGRSVERGQEDLRLMYGVVNSLTLFDWAASVMLAANAVLFAWMMWGREPKKDSMPVPSVDWASGGTMIINKPASNQPLRFSLRTLLVAIGIIAAILVWLNTW
jgi:hypothetical protein